MLRVLGSRAWHAGFTTPCQRSILPTALQSQVLACGLSPPLPSKQFLRTFLCHGIVFTPCRVYSCSAWLFLGGVNPPWVRIALTAEGQDFLCYQQHINTKINFSKVRLQAMLLYQGISPHTLMLIYTYRSHTQMQLQHKETGLGQQGQPRTEETWQHKAPYEGNACCRVPGTYTGFYPAKTERVESP